MGQRLVEGWQRADGAARLACDLGGEPRLHARRVRARGIEGPHHRRPGYAVAQHGQQEELDADALAPVPGRRLRALVQDAARVQIEVLVDPSEVHVQSVATLGKYSAICGVNV